jgi:hypothetical protein
MSPHVRLAALAGTLFVLSYISITWVMAGAPMPHLSLRLTQPETHLAAIPAAPLPTSRKPAQELVMEGGDGNPQRDKLRIAVLQASTGYARMPCDETAKAVMINAVSSYAKAWHDMMGCGPNGCDYKKINATAAAFSSPLDVQVRDAVGAAFDKRGISIDDFPSPLRINVAMLVRGRGAPATTCPETRAQAVR